MLHCKCWWVFYVIVLLSVLYCSLNRFYVISEAEKCVVKRGSDNKP